MTGELESNVEALEKAFEPARAMKVQLNHITTEDRSNIRKLIREVFNVAIQGLPENQSAIKTIRKRS